MEAKDAKLKSIMESELQFVVPIYQRKYSWEIKQCIQLWNDIIESAKNFKSTGHFIGSIVYMSERDYQAGIVPKLILIDGQQRITTFSLLLIALCRYIEKNNILDKINTEAIKSYFIVNRFQNGNDKYKLMLTEQDKETYIRIIEGTEDGLLNPSIRILKNFEFFISQIDNFKDDIKIVYDGINKLDLVHISLDRSSDNPQLIFESMNSTGMDLTQSDLVRNYLLLDLDLNEQERLYNNYWKQMENAFGQVGYTEKFDWFIRDYLTSKSNRIPKIGFVYEEFKKDYINNEYTNEDSLKDLYLYSRYYAKIVMNKETDEYLKPLWKEINNLKVDVSINFLLHLYNDYEAGKLNKEDMVAIVKTIISYVLRRAICGTPTNSLNKTFANLSQIINYSDYKNSVIAELLLKDSYREFPTDAIFKETFMEKDIYNTRIRNYILEKLENFNHNVPVYIENVSIEHIMPQSSKLSDEWKKALGNNWKEVQKKYVHTIGNLTFSNKVYNAEMQDYSFQKKLLVDGGIKNSKYMLSDDVSSLEDWNETEILERAQRLSDLALKIWEYPKIGSEILNKYYKKDNDIQGYTNINHYPVMNTEIKKIYEELDMRILNNIDSSVHREYKKYYVAYKSESNFIDLIIQQNQLKLNLNIPFDQIIDEKGICINNTNTGHWGNGPVELIIKDIKQVDYVMNMIKQAFNYQQDN